MIDNFEAMGLSADLLKGLNEIGIIKPTDIQQQAIPALLQDNPDFIGLAQTGTGKTAAFSLPLIEHTDTSRNEIQHIILAPTRELVQQIAKEIQSYARYSKNIKIEVVYGGTSIDRQIKSIKKQNPHILAATPGRLIDLIKRKVVDLTNISHFVLDEADEMLNMGFQEDIDKILSFTSEEKRIWLFSATMPSEIRRIIKNYMQNPVEVRVNAKNEVNTNIDHRYAVVKGREKTAALVRIVEFFPDFFGVVFCRTKRDTEQLASTLSDMGFEAEALNGDLSQNQRDTVMKRFRARNLRILVATDVAARGIDVENITHVIHYALPEDKSFYTHRSGRTARAGKKGMSIALVSPSGLREIKSIEKRLKITVNQFVLPGKEDVINQKVKSWTSSLLEGNETESKFTNQVMDSVLEAFTDISKEDLLRKLVNKELNAMGQRDMPEDLNAKPGRDSRSSGSGGPISAPSGSHRYFINIGKIDRLDKKELIHFISEQGNVQPNSINDVVMLDKHSFFTADKESGRKISQNLKKLKIEGRDLRVNRDDDGSSSSRPRGGGDKPKRKRIKKR